MSIPFDDQREKNFYVRNTEFTPILVDNPALRPTAVAAMAQLWSATGHYHIGLGHCKITLNESVHMSLWLQIQFCGIV